MVDSEPTFDKAPWELTTQVIDQTVDFKIINNLGDEIVSIIPWGQNYSEAINENLSLIVKAPDLFESHSYLLDAVKRLSEGKPIRDLDERILHAEKLVKEVLEGEK